MANNHPTIRWDLGRKVPPDNLSNYFVQLIRRGGIRAGNSPALSVEHTRDHGVLDEHLLVAHPGHDGVLQGGHLRLDALDCGDDRRVALLVGGAAGEAVGAGAARLGVLPQGLLSVGPPQLGREGREVYKVEETKGLNQYKNI